MLIRALTIAAALWATGPVLAQADLDPPYPIPADPGTFDLTGTWQYTTFDHRSSGPCPGGSHMVGTMSIADMGDPAVPYAVVVSGDCNPATVCVFGGKIVDGALVAQNDVVVDEEGGRVGSGLYITFFAEDFGLGFYDAAYYIADFSCGWSHSFSIRRGAAAAE